MKKYLQKLARRILQTHLLDLHTRIKNDEATIDILSREKEKLQKKLKRYERPENTLLSYYRIDNVGANGMPPSYLKPDNINEYTQRISEIESVYRNSAFREMMAWALNFHANMLAAGKIKNDMGDEIQIPMDHVRYMIDGIKSVWDLVVAAHFKDKELTARKTADLGDILDTPIEEGH